MHEPRDHRRRPLGPRALLVLAALGLTGCATMGASTRTLEQKPLVQAYERIRSEAEETKSQSEGCPNCVY